MDRHHFDVGRNTQINKETNNKRNRKKLHGQLWGCINRHFVSREKEKKNTQTKTQKRMERKK